MSHLLRKHALLTSPALMMNRFQAEQSEPHEITEYPIDADRHCLKMFP